ncbi:ABC transporter [Chloropicon primus]|nr:ABC transporter [Chloropicon primus]
MGESETGMKKSPSTEAFVKEEQSLGKDGALVFNKVGYRLPGGTDEGKWLVKGITGYVKFGQTLAIIGASGSGKTTTLDALALRMSTPVEGEIKINGQVMTESLFHKHCAYVMQDDFLWPALTVSENMQYAARLYLGESADQVKGKVESLIKAVGLSSCKDTKVGNLLLRGISGGQKKRLSLAIELLKSPLILFLDEPTSGLDSASAAAIMDLLDSIATKFNKAIVCSIHQPQSRIFLSFDQIMLLSQGSIAYFGPAKSACAYFETQFDLKCPSLCNPADFLMEVTNSDFRDSREEVEKLVSEWSQSNEAKELLEVANSLGSKELESGKGHKNLRLSQQLPVLLSRTFIGYLRDPTAYLPRVALYLNMSFFFGLCYFNIGWQNPLKQSDIFNRMFLWNWVTAFMSYMAMAAAPVYSLDAGTINRERMNNMYHPASLMASISICHLPFVLMLSFLSITPVYWIVGLNPKFDRYLAQVLVFFVHLYWVETLAFILGVLINNFIAAIAVMASFISMYFVLNGLFLETNSITWAVRWIHYLSPFKYTWESQAWLEFSGTNLTACKPGDAVCYGERGDDALAVVNGMDDVKWGLWLLVNLGFIIALRFAAYQILKRKDGKKKLRRGLLALVFG